MRRIAIYTLGVALFNLFTLNLGHAAPPAPGQKMVALTFDDGPAVGSGQTAKVLSVLRAHGNAPAAFFCVGQNLKTTTGKALAQQAAAQNCYVCNHTNTHAICTKLGTAAFKAEVNACQAAIQAATGQQNKYFRFPGGAGTAAHKATLAEMGITPVGWGPDSQDWCFAYYKKNGSKKYLNSQGIPAAWHEDYVGYVVDTVTKKGGGILLNHDIHPSTVAQLDQVLTKLEAKGFRFVSLSEYLAAH